MSRIATVARRDVRRALRSRLVWGAMILLGLMFLPSTASVAASGHREIGEFLLLMALDLITFALVVVAAVGYDAIVGERESGTLRTVLGLSGTRRDLVLGKFIARAAVVVLVMGTVLAIANVLVARGYGNPYLLPFWVMAGWMLAYGVVWTAVTVGYSAAFDSQYRTLGALVATYAAFSPALDTWSVLVRPLFSVVFTGSTATPAYEGLASAPLWLRVTERLNPVTGFYHAMRWSVGSVGPGTPTSGIALQLLGTAAFLCFGAISLLVGVRRFERADLCRNRSGSRVGKRLRRSIRRGVAGVGGVRRSASTTRASRVSIVARADLRHALRHWIVVGAILLVLLLVGPQLWTGLDPNSISTPRKQVADITHAFTLPVLILGIAVGYGAVVGERESGTLRLVLGSAGSRRELVAGKLASRLAVVVLGLAPTLTFAEAIVFMRFGDPMPMAFLAWAGWVLWTGLVWTAFVVGVSAAVSSRYRALAAAFGTYLLFGLWKSVARPLFSVVFTGRPGAYERYVHAVDAPAWFSYSDNLNPSIALQTVRDGFFIAVGRDTEFMHASLGLSLFSVCVALSFATLSLLYGSRRFDRSDLR